MLVNVSHFVLPGYGSTTNAPNLNSILKVCQT